jgi:hypothetical protein
MVVVIAVIVHPINTVIHTNVPEGFRWCVQFGTDATDAAAWLNAGWCGTQTEAAVTGEMVASAVNKALAYAGASSSYAGVIALAEDPIREEI